MDETKNENIEREALSRYLVFMHQSTKGLSKESVEKLFSVENLEKYENCKSSREFFEVLDSLELPEVKGVKIVDEMPRDGEKTSLDNFFESRTLPEKEEAEAIFKETQADPTETRKSLYDNVTGGAMAGAIAGAGAGALIGSSGAVVGGLVGGVAGGVAGAAGGAIGGLINWAIGR